VNQFVITAAFAALLMGWTVSVVALQITDDTQAPIVQNLERPPSACEQFEAATAFLEEDAGLPLLVLSAAGEAMGVPRTNATGPSRDPAADEAIRRLGQMLLLCTAETQEAAR
jgi:hypothetical protein